VRDAIAALGVDELEPEGEALDAGLEWRGDERAHAGAASGATPATTVSAGGGGSAARPSIRAIRAT
jgi:hypothetical protein